MERSLSLQFEVYTCRPTNTVLTGAGILKGNTLREFLSCQAAIIVVMMHFLLHAVMGGMKSHRDKHFKDVLYMNRLNFVFNQQHLHAASRKVVNEKLQQQQGFSSPVGGGGLNFKFYTLAQKLPIPHLPILFVNKSIFNYMGRQHSSS